MAVLRLKDGDLRVLGILSEAFRDAEGPMRPTLWTGKRLQGLAAAGILKGIRSSHGRGGVDCSSR